MMPRPALFVDAEQFRVTEPMRIPQVRPVMVDAMTGAVRGEYVRDLAIPAGFNLAFGVWTPRGWRVVTDGDWLIFGPGSEIGIWEHERFLRKFTRVEERI